VSGISGKARYAAQLLYKHPGVAHNPIRFFWRLVVWRARTALGRGTLVPFFTCETLFWCPAEWRGMAKMAYTLRENYEPELARLRDWVRPGATVIDVSARYGAYTVAMATLVGPSDRVYAIEPANHALSVLRQNIGINKFENVTVLVVCI
jgi:hypothetical protein